MAVAQSRAPDLGAQLRGKGGDERTREELDGFEVRERRPFPGEFGRGGISRIADAAHGRGRGEPPGVTVVAMPEHHQRIRESGDADPEAPRGTRAITLAPQWETRDLQDVVEEAHGDAGRFLDRGHV